MFLGEVGRAFHKLYEPFMAYKDELKILTAIAPRERFNKKRHRKIERKIQERT